MNMESMSMYSTQYLVGAPFAWITAAMRRGMESISLWHCSGVMRAQVALIVAFSSSALLGLAYRIFLFTIPHRFSMGLRSGEFAGQLRTGIPWSLNQVLVALALCAGANVRDAIQFYLYSAFNEGALSQSCFTENQIQWSKPRATVARIKLPGSSVKKPWAEPGSVGQPSAAGWHRF